MKAKGITITAVFLIIAIGNYFRNFSTGSIRTVEFVIILAIGGLIGVLIMQVVLLIKSKNK